MVEISGGQDRRAILRLDRALALDAWGKEKSGDRRSGDWFYPTAVQALENFRRHADVAPAGEVPGVGKVAALLRFHRLDPAVLPLEKDAGPIGLIDEGETATVCAEAGVALDEIILGQTEVAGDGGDLGLRNLHVPRPAAAVGTALAQVFGGFLHDP